MRDDHEPGRDPEIDTMMAAKQTRLVLALVLGGGALALLALLAFLSTFRFPF